MLAEIFHRVNGQPPMLLREPDLARWPGGAYAAEFAASDEWASIGAFGDGELLRLRDNELSTIVPLELGGALLVTAIYCDGDQAVNKLIDMIPVSGWVTLEQRLLSDGSEYVLFNSAIRGADFTDPKLQKKLLKEHGGLLKFQLPEGKYEIDWLGPWRPDNRTELWLTRLVRTMI